MQPADLNNIKGDLRAIRTTTGKVLVDLEEIRQETGRQMGETLKAPESPSPPDQKEPGNGGVNGELLSGDSWTTTVPTGTPMEIHLAEEELSAASEPFPH